MNFQFYLEKLYASESFKKFKQDFPDAYPCSAFFVVDLENLQKREDKTNFDFFVPSSGKLYSFQLESGVSLIPIENFNGVAPEKIKANYSFDFEEIEDIILKEMYENKINNKIQKYLVSLQAKEGKDFLLITVFISSMGIVKVLMDLDSKKITEFEKRSFFDMVNVFKKNK